MSKNEVFLWDQKYEHSREYKNLDDFTVFSSSNPTLSVLMDYLRSSMTVLEVGSGTGELIVYIEKKYPSVKTYGVDYSSVSINRSEHLVSRFKLTTSFIQADITRLPLADNSCDVVFGDQVIGHVGDMGAALKEIYRVLKPGGVCLLSGANKLRFDGWDLYKYISQKHQGYTQRSFFPWKFKLIGKSAGFVYEKGYGDMLLLFRNFSLIKRYIQSFFYDVSDEPSGGTGEVQGIKPQHKSMIKKVYNLIDVIVPWWCKVTIGVVLRKYEH